MSELTKQQLAEFADRVADRLHALNAQSVMDAELHASHHRTISEWITAEKARRDSARRIKEQVVGWFSISFIAGLVGFIVLGFIDWAKAVIKVGGV